MAGFDDIQAPEVDPRELAENIERAALEAAFEASVDEVRSAYQAAERGIKDELEGAQEHCEYEVARDALEDLDVDLELLDLPRRASEEQEATILDHNYDQVDDAMGDLRRADRAAHNAIKRSDDYRACGAHADELLDEYREELRAERDELIEELAEEYDQN